MTESETNATSRHIVETTNATGYTAETTDATMNGRCKRCGDTIWGQPDRILCDICRCIPLTNEIIPNISGGPFNSLF